MPRQIWSDPHEMLMGKNYGKIFKDGPKTEKNLEKSLFGGLEVTVIGQSTRNFARARA